LKHIGIKIDKSPCVYNWMLLGPNWMPEKVLFSPVASKFFYFWDLITKATQSGSLIARRKPAKQKYSLNSLSLLINILVLIIRESFTMFISHLMWAIIDFL